MRTKALILLGPLCLWYGIPEGTFRLVAVRCPRGDIQAGGRGWGLLPSAVHPAQHFCSCPFSAGGTSLSAGGINLGTGGALMFGWVGGLFA